MDNWLVMGGALLLISLVYPPFFGFVMGIAFAAVVSVFFLKLFGG